ncbi:MAG: type II toxin-antitoxin system HipA family toxin [Dysgonamonadaceae bacterium]|jgi:serine/threonine-protein kinase HipA|nr:type II toxin-antitoxin system HipA family toxin [Dysgonamonadaceae bacterium]
MVNYAHIRIWEDIAGTVSWDPVREIASFEYDPKFIAKGLDLSPLRMPLQAGRVYSFPELNRTTYKGLPGLLADSLPDKFGNSLINRWLAEQGRDPDSYNSVERLLYLGKRGMGALEFEPAEKIVQNTATKIELEGLIQAARYALADKEKQTADLHNEKEISQIIKVGTSAGGARAKAIVAYNENTGEIRSGQLNAPEGFSHWLIKLDGIDNQDKELKDPMHFGRIEYVYYLMAISCGIEMMESRLLAENGRYHFLTRRFDRIGNKEKFHMQTLCGLAHFDFNSPGIYAYEQLFQTMRTLRLPYTAAEQAYRRMVFNVVARNQDDHTKNISFLMNKEGKWRLAPAYDITFAYNPLGKYTSLHQMTINGKQDGFTKSDFLQVAKSMNIKKANEIIEEVIESVSQWKRIAKEYDIPSSQIKMIEKGHRLLFQ